MTVVANASRTSCASALTERHYNASLRSLVATAGPGRDITNRQLLQVMASVPRHEFVPVAQRHLAYQDCPLPIGELWTLPA